jgi:DNA-binding transcriptional MerR regulator
MPEQSQNGQLTIDELAQRTGMTVRNIRAHQSRGLLPPPDVRGRTGYYGDEHVARIQLIQEMQGDGLNLAAIRRLLEGVEHSSAEVLDFTRALRAPFEDEQPEYIEAAELAERWTVDGKPPRAEVLRRAIKLGFLRPAGEDRFEVVSPTLARAGAELAQLGADPDDALDVLEKMRRSSRTIARTFVDVFITAVWEPFDREGRPEEDWPKVSEALERLRPLASESMLAVFQLTMSEATESALDRTLQRTDRGAEKPRKRRRRR